MTITLAPQTEEKLKEMAMREGRDENTLADTLLAEVLEATNRDFEEACQAVAEALASDPKHDISLEDFQGKFEAERQSRKRLREDVKGKMAA